MSNETSDGGLRARISRQGEDALARLAQELLDSPIVSGALARALDAREKAAQAQEIAMGALNLPSAGDLERLTRRVRSVSQRLEGVEDALDRLEERLERVGGAAALERRLDAVEDRLATLVEQVARLADRLEDGAPAAASAARRAPTRSVARASGAAARAGTRAPARRRTNRPNPADG